MRFFSLGKGDSNKYWEKKFNIDPRELEFELKFYDLFSGDEKVLMEKMRTVLTKMGRGDLSGPIYLIVRELLTNSLKALYKRIYFDFFLAEVGYSDLPYEEWLEIFKTEIETHMAENFANICREKEMYVEFTMKPLKNDLIFEIVNEGVPSDVEWKRLNSSFDKAKSQNDMSYLFLDDTEEDELQEGAGIGVPLISIMLKNMKLQFQNFQILVENGRTVARLIFPMTIFEKSQQT